MGGLSNYRHHVGCVCVYLLTNFRLDQLMSGWPMRCVRGPRSGRGAGQIDGPCQVFKRSTIVCVLVNLQCFVHGHVNVLPVCVHVSLGYLLSFPTGWTWKGESGSHVPWPGQGALIPKHWSGPQQPAGAVLGWSCWRGSYTLLCLPHLTNSISLSLHLKSPKGCKFSLILLPSVRLRFNRKKVEKILSSWSLVFNLIERMMFPEWDTVGEMSS